ncbi:YggS family pyridoxal phosphate-dependent enzyme, partial [bacterium]|nr:YggS family pyridoxal phosphate-dependent enzyme [bacterium]
MTPTMGIITENVRSILSGIPDHVDVVAIAKGHTPEQIREAVDAGIRIIGENYLQEAKTVIHEVGSKVSWHFTGHVQKNKVKHIVPLFDMIQTVDSLALAWMLDEQAKKLGRVMPVLIEVNSAHEEQKSGAIPDDVPGLIRQISTLPGIRVQGLMTMGPFLDDPAGLRPFFREPTQLFDAMAALAIENVEMR